MENTYQQLEQRFNNLPKDVRRMLLSEDFGLIVQLIGGDVGITPEQALDVEGEVVTVLVGTSHPKDFIRNMQSKIGVDEEKARAIAEKVNDEIFQLVKESLKIVHNITGEASLASLASGASAPKPPAPPTAPFSFPQMIVPPTPQGASLASGASTASISKTPEAPKPSQNIFEQKLQGVFKMPKEETLVPQKPSSPPTPPTPPRAGGVDPYREQAK